MGNGETRTDLGREAGWLALFVLGLLAALVVEHYAVHVHVVLPALDHGPPPPWTWGTLYVPELLAAFAAGWRLRSAAGIVVYAAAAAALRFAFRTALTALGEPGHAPSGEAPYSEYAFTAPAVVLAYLAVLALASWSGRSERRLVL